MAAIQFTGSWDTATRRQMEKAADENSVLEIVLPEKEYRRLTDGGFDTLKKTLPPEVASLLSLQEKYPLCDYKPTLIVGAHRGPCVH